MSQCFVISGSYTSSAESRSAPSTTCWWSFAQAKRWIASLDHSLEADLGSLGTRKLHCRSSNKCAKFWQHFFQTHKSMKAFQSFPAILSVNLWADAIVIIRHVCFLAPHSSQSKAFDHRSTWIHSWATSNNSPEIEAGEIPPLTQPFEGWLLNFYSHWAVVWLHCVWLLEVLGDVENHLQRSQNSGGLKLLATNYTTNPQLKELTTTPWLSWNKNNHTILSLSTFCHCPWVVRSLNKRTSSMIVASTLRWAKWI